jgi:hypothetical protein
MKVGVAAALLVSIAILFFHRERQVALDSQRTNVKSEATVEFKPVLSKETDPCNILPPLEGWRS